MYQKTLFTPHIMSAIYVHIPFCKQRCIYCDFYSTSLHGMIDDYVNCVCREAAMRRIDGEVRTLYMGGGTPSQLSAEQISRIAYAISKVHNLTALEEFTVEVNPDDVTVGFVGDLVSLGVNRISMGIQSFDDAELRTINRRHDSQRALQAIRDIRAAGIENVSIDLIYGIPGQTMESWRRSVKAAIAAGVQHISAYNLSYEEGTPLWRMRDRGEIIEVDDLTCIGMYNELTRLLREAGYQHYEISNFSLPGWHSRHNSSYWDSTPYLGLGAAAHSYDGLARSYNVASVKEYIEKINAGVLPSVVEELQEYERYDEMIMVALRTTRGLEIERIVNSFPAKYHDHLMNEARRFLETGDLVVDSGRLCIPEDRIMTSDYIIRELMWDGD